MKNLSVIVNDLAQVIESRELSTQKSWNYGWSQTEYRQSRGAAIEYNKKNSVQLPREAVALFEKVTNVLLREKRIQSLYEKNEFWSLMASLIGTLPLKTSGPQIRAFMEEQLTQLLNPRDSLVLVPVANIASLNSIVDMGPLLVGHYGEAFENKLLKKTGKTGISHVAEKPWWQIGSLERENSSAKSPILLACQGQAQLERAINEAKLIFDDLTNLALMVQEDLDALALYSLRGDTNRPGIRGLVIDRAELSRMASDNPKIRCELYSTIVIDGLLGPHTTHRWYGEDPFPLEKLLSIPRKREIAERVLLTPTPVFKRLRVAARWHAKAHWALEKSDAVLALGICFDSMLTETGPSPGRVISERFALLHPDPTVRRSRYKVFQKEFYPARSSVAHGAESTANIDTAFVRRMAKESRWVFKRIFQVVEGLRVSTEEEYAKMFESLKWDPPSEHPL